MSKGKRTENWERITENLENGYYLKPEFNSSFKNEVELKIEEFSSWFNSTARLYFLKCDPTQRESCVYLILNLKKKLKFAISEINRSVTNRHQSYICDVCDVKIEVQPWQNVWDRLQDHPHFEECYSKAINKTPNAVIEHLQNDNSSRNDLVKDDLSQELSQVAQDDFKFNFEVPYDERVENTLYPETLVRAAQNVDHLPEYTIQRHDIDQGVCLLCPCDIIPKGKISRMTPFVIKSHAYGNKHLRSAATKANLNALKKYHEFWRKKETAYQSHQVYFIPDISALDHCKCRLCQQSIPYDDVINHIKKNKLHRIRVLKIFNSPKEKLNQFSLIDMQAKMYGDPKNEKKQSPKKQVSGTAHQPPCVFAKFVIKPNQVNLQPRYKDHSKFFTKSASFVTCRICKQIFCNSSTVIRRHILSAQHTQLSEIPVPKYSFYCDICKTEVKDEEAWDDHFSKGSNNHDNISQRRKFKVTEYECSTCNVVIYGDESSLNRHISSRPPKESLPIEQEVSTLQSEETKEDYKETKRNLVRLLSQLFPSATITLKEGSEQESL